MKKIILILISFLLILMGCSVDTYTAQDLIDDGYQLNEATNTMEIVSNHNSKVFVELNDTKEPTTVGIEYEISSYQTLDLRYVISEETWSASHIDGEIVTEVEPKDAYAYIIQPAPEMGTELLTLAEKNNISTKELENGDAGVVEELFTPDMIVSNLQVTDSTYTSPYAPEDYLYPMHYVQVNFDFTNKTNEDINLAEVKFDVCYTLKESNDCTELESAQTSDTDLNNKILKPEETISIQLTALIPTEVTNYWISFAINDKKINVESPYEE